MSAVSGSPSPAAAKGRGGGSMKTPIGGEDVCALVVQVGDSSIRVGYAQEDHPRIYASAIVGRRKLRVPPKTSKIFCGSCCCCDSKAAVAAAPDVVRCSNGFSSSEQQQEKWSKSSGVSPSVCFGRGPFAWGPESRSCCSCSCCHPDLVFPVNVGVPIPHTDITPIIAAPADFSSENKQQTQRKERQLDREAFSKAVRICIEGHVPQGEEKRRVIRPPKKLRQQEEAPKTEQSKCKCCCAKQHPQQPTAAAAAAAGQCNGLSDGPADTELKTASGSSNSNCSSVSSSSLLEAFGCTPFGGLGVWTHEHPVLVVEPTLHSPTLREAMAEALFEDLQVSAAFFAKSATLAAFAMGRASALVVELGSTGGTVSAVCDGYTLRRSATAFAVGGNFMDKQIELVLLQQLQQQQRKTTHPDLDFSSQQRLLLPLFAFGGQQRQPRSVNSCSSSLLQRSTEELCRQVREACCVVRSYEDAALPLVTQSGIKGAVDTPEDPLPRFELPDGTPVDVGGIRHAVAELLFQPKAALEALQQLQPPALRQDPDTLLQGFKGLPNAVADCVYANDVDVRRDLLSAVVLTGGLALTPGLPERFSDELHSEAFGPCNGHSGLKVRVVCPNSQTERRSAAWLGGSILASLGTFQEMWISKREYEEYGPDILEKRAL